MQRSVLGELCASALKSKGYNTTVPRRNGSTSSSSSTRRFINPNAPQDIEELLHAQKWSKKLVDSAACGEAKGEGTRWSFGYQSRTKQEERLTRAVQIGAKKSSVFSTPDQIQSVEWDSLITEPIDMTRSDLVTPPGTLVEIRRSGEIIHGVVIGSVKEERGLRTISLTSAGSTLSHGEHDIMLSIPSYIDAALAKRCGGNTMEPDPSELKARVTVLKAIRSIERAIEEVSNLVYTRAQGLYETFRSSDPEQWSQFDTSTAAKTVEPSTSVRLPVLFAMHKFLMAHPVHFVAHPTSYQFTHSFLVRPKSHVDTIETVTTWMRDQNNGALNTFVEKSRRVLAESRRLRGESLDKPPHVYTAGIDDIVFDDNDRVILQFLYDSFHPARSIQQSPYAIPATYIVKRLGEDPFPARNLEILLRVLTDMGVFTPWEDTPTIASRVDVLSNRPSDRPLPILTPVNQHPLGPDDLYATDPLESIRHDFGDMPVYVIDDVTAEELDDGISIETNLSDPRCTWVHVHVADPTRLLPHTHRIATQARQNSQTMYFIHGSKSMLPSNSIFHALSLGTASATGKAEHVMTFSIKVDEAGDIIDYKVRAGIVRNVRTITYDDVDQLLNIPPCQRFYPFQSETPLLPARASGLNPSDVGQLRSLFHLSQKLVESRNRSNVFMFTFPSSEVSFVSKDLPQSPSLKTLYRPHFFCGFPAMTYTVSNLVHQLTGSRVMVSEFMKAASRVASRFGVDGGIPLIRRGCAPAITPNPEDLLKLSASRDDMGLVDPWAAIRSGILIPRVLNTIQPKGHWTLGIPEGEGYVRATSPLRRYADLVTHWQIKHALLNPNSQSLFSEAWMADFANELTLKEREAKRLESQHQAYWSALYVKRWLDGLIPTDLDPKGTLVARPASVPIMDGRTGAWSTTCMLPKLGLWGELPGKETREIGSEVPVRIAGVAMGVRPLVTLVPV